MKDMQIQDFLHYGYSLDEAGLNYLDLEDEDYSQNIEGASKVLEKTFDSIISGLDSGLTHIVPLSGGLDSRAILAELLEHDGIDRDNIIAVTFGTPGTWDFEIPKKVAKKAGVEHHTIDIKTEIEWSKELLLDYASKQSRPHKFFDGYINKKIFDRFSAEDTVFWSGFLGDPTAGAHIPEEDLDTWEEYLEWFASWNKAFDTSFNPNSYDAVTDLPSEPLMSEEKMNYYDQLDLGVRQRNLIKPIVMPNEKSYLTPFASNPWLSYALKLPEDKRKNRKLFKEVMLERHPVLFDLPTDTNAGLPLNTNKYRVKLNHYLANLKIALGRTNLYLNYIDFEKELRKNTSISKTVKNSVKSLDIQEIDVETLWKDHQEGKNLSDELLSLASLSLYLESKE